MDQATHNKIVSFLWGIADDVLRDLFKRGKYPDVILPDLCDRLVGRVKAGLCANSRGSGVGEISPRHRQELAYFLRIRRMLLKLPGLQ